MWSWDDDKGEYLEPKLNHPLIKKLREWHSEGWTLIVWTSNYDGSSHAKEWVEKCGLEDIVFSVQIKPFKIVDDDTLEYYKVIDPKTLSYK